MPEIRYNILSGDVVVVAGERAKRPLDFKSAQTESSPAPEKDPRCPFCEGNEHMTPPEVYAERDVPNENGPGWAVRVVPNKFPAFIPKEELSPEEAERLGWIEKEPPGADDSSMYWESPAVGAHEVVIESPAHNGTLGSIGSEHLQLVLKTIKMRTQILYDLDYIKYGQVFRNQGPRGGASLAHPHFQIMGLPFVPESVLSETRRFDQYEKVTGRCLLCDYLEREIQKGERVIKAEDEFVVLSPFAPKYSYETLVVPRRHKESYLDATDSEGKDLAETISWLFEKYESMFKSLSYNIVFHIGPKGKIPCYHWHIHVYPRLNVEAGLELGTGVYINPTSPEAAAREFAREASIGA